MNINISTSYYANINKIRKEYPDSFLISISRTLNDNIKDNIDFWDTRLAPNIELLSDYKNNNITLSELEYIDKFKKDILDKINLKDILSEYSGKDIVLMCYEGNSPDRESFCHRRIIAESIENSLDIKVPELFFDYSDKANCIIEDYKVKTKYTINEDEW